MTISSETNKIVYACDNSTTEFPYTFKIIENNDLLVTLYNEDTYEETTLVLDTDYTVTGAGVETGGNVTTVSTYDTTYKLIIQRNVGYLQETDYVNNEDLDADTLENSFDTMVMMIQQLKETVDRCLKFTEQQQLLMISTLSTGYLYYDGSNLSFTTLSISETTYTGQSQQVRRLRIASPLQMTFAWQLMKIKYIDVQLLNMGWRPRYQSCFWANINTKRPGNNCRFR